MSDYMDPLRENRDLPAFISALGMTIREIGEELVVDVDVPDAFYTMYGAIHGGLLAAVMDAVGVMVVASHLTFADRTATHSFNLNYLRALALVAFAAMGLAACSSPTDSATTSKAMEERMRAIEKRVKDSLPKTQEIALAQKVDPDVLKKVQAELRTLDEYLDDPPSGKIDMVTVNAIEAFQRRAGLRDDGLLDPETLERLDAAAKQRPASG